MRKSCRLPGTSALIRLRLFLLAVFVLAPSAMAAGEPQRGVTRYVFESPLPADERLEAIRFLQSRILQPAAGWYLVRDARVLLPQGEPGGVFAFLVSLQTERSSNGVYDLSDFYQVQGFYILFVCRQNEGFELLGELSVTPDCLSGSLNPGFLPPPPGLTSDPQLFDFTGAVFNAMDPAVVAWRDNLAENPAPRCRWLDLTGDGFLDFVLDLEGLEVRPQSCYSVFVSTETGFEKAFDLGAVCTDFVEVTEGAGVVVRADRYDSTDNGEWLCSWRDYYKWFGQRFIMANADFAERYSELVPGLERLARETVAAETERGGRWEGRTRFLINASRYVEGTAVPTACYFNLARIAEYQSDWERAARWWQTLIDYVDSEYDSQAETDLSTVEPSVMSVVYAYEEWRDELYAAAESALSSSD